MVLLKWEANCNNNNEDEASSSASRWKLENYDEELKMTEAF